MDESLQSHLPELRQLLVNRLHELRAEIEAAAESARQQASAAAAREVTDHKDEALQSQMADLDDTQFQRDREEMLEIEDALARLDAGAYGHCADCGCPIELPRLLVMPAARRCAACQFARERTAARPAVG